MQITRQILTVLTVFGAATTLLAADEPNAAEELGMFGHKRHGFVISIQ